MSGTIPEHTVLTGFWKRTKIFVNIITAVSSARSTGKSKLIKEDNIFKEVESGKPPKGTEIARTEKERYRTFRFTSPRSILF
jgi:hypothetical protein